MKLERNLLKREEMFWWSCILTPLFLGMVLYSIINMPYLLTGLIDRLYGPGRITFDGRELISERTFLILLTYGRDFLWAFSLVFAVSRLYGRTLSGLKKAFSLVLIFEVLVGIWKIFGAPQKGLELTGIAAVVLADTAAALIILLHKRVLA